MGIFDDMGTCLCCHFSQVLICGHNEEVFRPQRACDGVERVFGQGTCNGPPLLQARPSAGRHLPDTTRPDTTSSNTGHQTTTESHRRRSASGVPLDSTGWTFSTRH